MDVSFRYGLTLPTGIPSPESPADGTVLDASTLVDPQFMCSTPLLPRAALNQCHTKVSMAERMQGDFSHSSHATDRPNVTDADFDSASMLANRGSPGCPDDTWDSHRVQLVVRTPAVKAPEEDSDSDNATEYGECSRRVERASVALPLGRS